MSMFEQSVEDSIRDVAQETMVGDLIAALVDELKVAPDVWQKMSESKQTEVIERLEKRVRHNIARAVTILASEDRPTIRGMLEQITVKDEVKAVVKISKRDPGFVDLVEATADEILIVLPNLAEYRDQPHGTKADPDQPGLPLEDDETDGPTGDDPLINEAIDYVVSSRKSTISAVQRAVKVGYNRAARLVELMEKLGIVSPVNDRGMREVLIHPTAGGES